MINLNIFIKRKIHLIVNFFGYKILGAKKTVKHNDFDSIIKFIFNEIITENKSERTPTIFDIGANDGQSIRRFKKIFNVCKITSFEPTPIQFNNIKERYKDDEDVSVYNYGISNKEEILKFHSYEFSLINSFIPADNKSKLIKSRILSRKSNELNFENIIEVKTKSLDKFCLEKSIKTIDILKIDTQGFEDKVLNGCEDLLKKQKINIIEVELILGFGYSKTLSFYDIEKYLRKYDYRLISINNSGNVISTSNYVIDLLYVHQSSYEKIKELHYKNKNIKDVTNKTNTNNPFTY